MAIVLSVLHPANSLGPSVPFALIEWLINNTAYGCIHLQQQHVHCWCSNTSPVLYNLVQAKQPWADAHKSICEQH